MKLNLSPSTNFSTFPLDQLIPVYRARELGIPDWCYEAAKRLAREHIGAGSGGYFSLPGGLSVTGLEAEEAISAAIISVYYKIQEQVEANDAKFNSREGE